MNILLVCMKYDYGIQTRGLSYEYHNFLKSLEACGHQVVLFDYMEELRQQGKERMNGSLVELVASRKPDVAIFSLYTDQLLPEAVERVRQHTRTLCFFHDDTWRKEFSRAWAPHFDFFTSSDFEAKRKYARLGLPSLIHFPFGVNHELYQPQPVEKIYDVSFVGAWHPYREWLIKRLRRANIRVETAGSRWPRGIVSQEEMIRMFNQSHINLNLSNSCSWDARYLLGSVKGMINTLHSGKNVEQIKARHFEINACRAFQLSYYVDGLERCYRIGEEMAVYLDPDDLVDKVQYYLADDELRENMAEKAYQRTLNEHTYAQRFKRVFEQMGLETA